MNSKQVDDDSKSAVKVALERKGVLKDIKARLRAEIYSSLEDKSVQMPEKTGDIFLATELVRELLVSLKLGNSLSVFNEEIGQPSEMTCDKDFIAGELGFNVSDTVMGGKENLKGSGSSRDIPLLMQLMRHLRASKSSMYEAASHPSMTVEYDNADLDI